MFQPNNSNFLIVLLAVLCSALAACGDTRIPKTCPDGSTLVGNRCVDSTQEEESNPPSATLPDTDQDGVEDSVDAFPSDSSEQVDSDSDGTGDNADAFPSDPTEQSDRDNDGTGDNADAFPSDPTEQSDRDNDGTGDNADAFPHDPSEVTDADQDGVGDNADLDPANGADRRRTDLLINGSFEQGFEAYVADGLPLNNEAPGLIANQEEPVKHGIYSALVAGSYEEPWVDPNDGSAHSWHVFYQDVALPASRGNSLLFTGYLYTRSVEASAPSDGGNIGQNEASLVLSWLDADGNVLDTVAGEVQWTRSAIFTNSMEPDQYHGLNIEAVVPDEAHSARVGLQFHQVGSSHGSVYVDNFQVGFQNPEEPVLPEPAPAVLFFSEYAEGSSNNKYLEIYNPTDAAIDLGAYAYPSTANAPSAPGVYEYWNTFEEGATIEAGGVYVICHTSSDPSILAACDEHHTYLSNGNDGYCLVRGTEDDYTLLDCVGDWHADPGAGWSVAGVSDATKDHTLVRKSAVLIGNGGDWQGSAGTMADDSEWIVLGMNTWADLGMHPTNMSEWTNVTASWSNGGFEDDLTGWFTLPADVDFSAVMATGDTYYESDVTFSAYDDGGAQSGKMWGVWTEEPTEQAFYQEFQGLHAHTSYLLEGWFYVSSLEPFTESNSVDLSFTYVGERGDSVVTAQALDTSVQDTWTQLSLCGAVPPEQTTLQAGLIYHQMSADGHGTVFFDAMVLKAVASCPQ